MNILVNLGFAALILFLLHNGGWAQTTLAQPDKKLDGVETEIFHLEELGRQKVLNGNNEWDGLIADGAYMIGPHGNVMTYEKGKGFPPFPVLSFKISDLIVRNYGETAVASGFAVFESPGPDKKPVSYQMRFINVWRKFSDGWKIAVSERTTVQSPMTMPKKE